MTGRTQQRLRTQRTALVLSGGGARAAYQVGVLQAIRSLHGEQPRRLRQSPFGILVGTSAGAINIAALASGADRFDRAVAKLEHTWANLRVAQVYRADAWSVVGTGARWLQLLSAGWALARWRRGKLQSLLDNRPLAQLLQHAVDFPRIPRMIERGMLHAVAISASSYTSGQHVTFYDSAQALQPWQRSQRETVRGPINARHLLASSSIPFVFPAQKLAMPDGMHAFFGDGSMRQQAPLAPAIHLGAERILVVGVGRSTHAPTPPQSVQPPSLAQIAGHALSSIFLDMQTTDIERLTRINQMLTTLAPAQAAATGLRPIELLTITPSRNIDDMAAEHMHHLPRSIRALLGALGTGDDARELGHSALTSYLLFEAAFTQALMALGQRDALARSDAIAAFLGWQAVC